MKMAGKKEQVSGLIASIFVPTRATESAGSRDVEMGDETFSSPSEMSSQEASANGTSAGEDLYQPATQTGQVL